jgi:predicted PurR-regulated permease PerM
MLGYARESAILSVYRVIEPRGGSLAVDIYQFVKANKKVMIWAGFFAMLFLVRKVFGLVFLTYILCYIFNNIIVQLESHIRWRRRAWTVVVYLFFVSAVVALLLLVMPHILDEAKLFITKLPQSIDAVHLYLDQLAYKQPQMAPVIDRVKEAVTIKNLLGINREALVDFVVGLLNRTLHFTTYFLLATLFSFLILLDVKNLRARVYALRDTRFQDVYDETAGSVAQFALVVGYTFQAQILIAVLNTLLTVLGLWFLQLETIALLASIVFFAGLIPVWGTFISSIPILLLSFNEGGMVLAGKAVLMIVFVHVVEAYILNPRILSAVLKINPLLTLIILYVGHSLFGLWGILLGVPVAVYVYRYILMIPGIVHIDDGVGIDGIADNIQKGDS